MDRRAGAGKLRCDGARDRAGLRRSDRRRASPSRKHILIFITLVSGKIRFLNKDAQFIANFIGIFLFSKLICIT